MKKTLKAYNDKRDFNKTNEPTGKVKKTKNKKLKYTIQHHLARRDHYDFRLEWDGVLLSWAIPKGPSFNPHDKRLAVHVEDHPLDYAKFEGIIPAHQYGGGTVMLWDEGIWTPQENFAQGLKSGSLKINLDGQRLKGQWALVQMHNDKNWLLIKERDEFAKKTPGISRFTRSVKTNRTMQEIAQEVIPAIEKNPFQHLSVQLAKLVDTVPEDDDWAYEIKYDGYRTIAYVDNHQIRLLSRNDLDMTKKFQTIADDLKSLAQKHSAVFDGEMVVFDKSGKSDFQALQSYIKHPKDYRLTYVVFDLLAYDGVDLRDQPLLERKKKLAKILKKSANSIVYSEHIIGNGKEVFQKAKQLDLEGIIGKRIESSYAGNRNGEWIKLKCRKQQEFVIGGYAISTKPQRNISSLLLGYYTANELIYAGRVGSGFDVETDRDLSQKLNALKISSSPFANSAKTKTKESIVWVKPKLIGEVEFAEWTKEQQLRQASFKGLRIDKAVKSVHREVSSDPLDEENSALGINISNPQKLVYQKPKITKMDVINYYLQVAERMMPFVEKRLLSAVRCHEGVNSSCFFKKHPNGKIKGIYTKKIKNSHGESSEYFYIKDQVGLIAEAQLGTLEFHTWGSTINALEKPDIMVFDLDPDQDMSMAKVRQGVRDLKTVLDELHLVSFLKTSGGKGYHIVVPFVPQVNWNVFHDFARQIADYMEEKWPNRYTSNVRKVNRKGKIFIDWIRNGRGATSVAPYSLRAREGAGVSFPISWDELDKVKPNGIDLREALKRIKKQDPWKDFWTVKQYLS